MVKHFSQAARELVRKCYSIQQGIASRMLLYDYIAKEQYLYMTLLDLSVRLIQSERRNDTEPYESVMNNLTAEILATLGDKS